MKLNELILNKDLTREEFIEKYVVRMYVPINAKFETAKSIAKVCIEEDEDVGGFIENVLFSSVLKLHTIIKMYTNIEVEEDQIIDDYDLIKEYRDTPLGHILSEEIYSMIQDVCELEILISKQIQVYLDAKNSLAVTVGNGIKMLMDKIPSQADMNEVIDKTKETFDKMSPKKLKGIVDVIEKITPEKK